MTRTHQDLLQKKDYSGGSHYLQSGLVDRRNFFSRELANCSAKLISDEEESNTFPEFR